MVEPFRSGLHEFSIIKCMYPFIVYHPVPLATNTYSQASFFCKLYIDVIIMLISVLFKSLTIVSHMEPEEEPTDLLQYVGLTRSSLP